MNTIHNILIKAVHAGSTSINVGQPTNMRATDVGTIIKNLLNATLIISAILAFIFLVLGGIQWITSGGDKSAMENARNKITQAIVGLIIVAAAYAVMTLVSSFLGIDITRMDVGTIYQ